MRARRGYDDIYRVEYPAVLRVAYLMLGDRSAAEDAAQEAFARLYVHWPKVSRYARPDLWLRKIVIQQASRAKQRRARWVALGDDTTVEDRPVDVDLHRAIEQLHGKQRGAIVLHYLEDRPVAEIAEALGCAEATAKVHLHRGRQRLAELMGKVPDDVVR